MPSAKRGRQCLRSLDFARNYSGNSILDAIFYLHSAYIPLLTAGLVFFLLGGLIKSNYEFTKTVILVIIMEISVVVLYTFSAFLLWNGWKLKSQSSLKRYIKVMIPLGIVGPGFGIYMKLFAFREDSEPIWSLTRALNIMLQIPLLGFLCYILYLIKKCILMMNAPWLSRVKEEFQNNYFNTLGNNRDRNSKIEIETPGERSEENVKSSDIVDIQDFLISPLIVEFGYDEVLGEGQFGIVCKGRLFQKQEGTLGGVLSVALKQVKNPEICFESFVQEIKIMIRVGQHKNIVQFYGLTSNGLVDNHLAMITEFCDGGSLDLFLKKKRHTFVNLLGDDYVCLDEDRRIYTNLDNHGTHTTKDLMRIAAEIADGMEYLVSKKIVHGDLASRNVLLDGPSFTVKLTDFGMSRRLYNYELYFKGDIKQQCLVPWRWMAPEALIDLKFSEKSDIWSYGVVLWEIFTLGEFPYKDLNWSQDVLKQLREGLRLDKPRYSTLDIWNLMNTCWAKDRRARTTFSQICQWWNESNLNTATVTDVGS